MVLALGHAAKVVSIPVSGQIATKTQNLKLLLMTVVLLTTVSAAGYNFAYTLPAIMSIYLLVNAFSSNMGPIGDALILPIIKRHNLDYGSSRLWGSVSIVFLAFFTGQVVGLISIDWVILILICAYASILLVIAPIQVEPRVTTAGARSNFFSALKETRFRLLVCSAGVCQASHAFMYSYGSLYWLSHGLTPQVVGALWSLGVISEVAVFSLSKRYLKALSPEWKVTLACMTAVIRWLLLGAFPNLAAAIVVQALQGGTLALTQIGVAEYINQRVHQSNVASATTTYAFFSYAILMATATYFGGLLYSIEKAAVFMMAAGWCAFGFTAAVLNIRRQRTFVQNQ